MHRIGSVSIEGFWDSHDIEFRLFPEVTFFIGQNGSGKTTLINLIAAVLKADFVALNQIAFRRVTVTLERDATGNLPTIIVNKTKRQDRNYFLIEYRIKSSQNSKEVRFALDELAEQYMDRRYSRLTGLGPYGHIAAGVGSKLAELVEVNWLSVQRTPVERTRDDSSFQYAVDLRLADISNEMVRLFSSFARNKDVEVQKFQEYLLVSLLREPPELDLFDTQRLSQLNYFEASLQNIFSEMHVKDEIAMPLIEDFFDRAKKIDQANASEDGKFRQLSLSEVVTMTVLRRISNLSTQWADLQIRIDEIFAPRDRFLNIANELFQRKKMELSARNELHFVSRSGKVLETRMLSSGEKHLLILLSETMLQQERKTVFIADEPELSLHVLWQEKLITSLRSLNPSAQIIAATHSPDIVGPLGRFAIDMETLIP